MIQSTSSNSTADRRMNRRQFLAGTAAVAAFSIVPRHVLGGGKYVAPSEKIRLAIIGCGGQGGGIGRLMGSKDISRVVALCDVAMEDGRTKGTREKFPDAPRFQDFRKMFDKMEDDIDACSIGVPDHAHFCIAMLAMSKGKHVYVEKPLANTFEECQLLIDAEKKYGVACQMGNQGHSGNNPQQFRAYMKAGYIKNVKKVYGFMTRGRRWHGWEIDGYPNPGDPCPPTMDWDLWTGPAEKHPYSKKYDPGNWRSWYIYGNGAFGDWGPHILDGAHRFLELGLPTEIEAVKLDGPNDYIFPQASTIAFRFPARGNMPPCEMTWWDGRGNNPPAPPELEGRKIGSANKIIFAEDYTFYGGSHGSVMRIIPESKHKEVAPNLPKWEGESDHYTNFLRACRGEEKTHSPFRVGGELTQVFTLGVIAQRYGGTLKFDPKTRRITNNAKADAMLRTPPRKGWEQYYKL